MLSIEVPKETRRAELKILHAETFWKIGIKKGANNAATSVIRRTELALRGGTRSGKKYPGLPNRSSAPGEYPREQSGRLRRSLYKKVGTIKEFRIGAKAPHGVFLEKGTPRMSARPNRKDPWLLQSIRKEERITENYLREGVIKEVC